MLAILAAAFTALEAKDKPGKGKGKGKGAHEHAFLPQERTIIIDYYRSGPSGLPPGLAKRGGDLPPGLEKHIRRNGQLPPGLQKKLMPFPPVLATRLRPLPLGYERGIIGGFAIIWSPRTRVIVDVVALFGD